MTGITLREYAVKVCSAMALHEPCRALMETAQAMFILLSDKHIDLADTGIQTLPRDYEFSYTGGVTFRWHDSKDNHFGGCLRWAGFRVIEPGKVEIQGTLPRSKNDRYSPGREGGVFVSGLEMDDAAIMLAMLIRIVEKGQNEEDITP